MKQKTVWWIMLGYGAKVHHYTQRKLIQQMLIFINFCLFYH